jgi:cysteine desulfuration protein SufE
MTRLQQRTQELATEFEGLNSWEEKYRHLMKLGGELPQLPDALYDEKYKVRGCQSQVWLHAGLTPDNLVKFEGDSDAMIVKGLVAILLRIYSNATPDEILNHPPDFFKDLGLGEHLSPSRSNGFYAMVKQIMLYAAALKALARPN